MARPAKKSSPKKAAKSPSKVKVPKTKRAKKEKDPNAPKRGKSAYMFWLADNRSRLTKPGMSVVDVSRVAGVEWNGLKDKTKWEKAAAEDKKRYEKAIAAYKAGGGSPAKSPKKAAKAKGKK